MRRCGPLVSSLLLVRVHHRSSGVAAVTVARRWASSSAPAWVAELRDAARTSERNISYDIKIYDELAWRRRPFTFDRAAWEPSKLSSITRQKLCLGDEHKEYTVIGEAFPFPDRNDSPVVNEPASVARLLWDHNSPTEKIAIQLSPHFPPLLWSTVKPTIAALRRVFAEFLEADAQHAKKYLPYYESVQASLESRESATFGADLSNTKARDRFVEDMRKKDPASLDLDWQHQHTVFVGTVDHFRQSEDRMMKDNPFVFGWPLLVGDGNHHLEGTPLRMSAFRTIYSKSMIMLHSRLDLQLDQRQCKLAETDETDMVLEVPVFATVNFPENTRLSGGAALVERFNKVMGTSWPPQTPLDVLAAFAGDHSVKGIAELRADLQFLKAATEKVPDIERVIRLSPDLVASNRIVGQLAYTIVYLALAEDPRWVEDIYATFSRHPAEMIRVACAKGAHIFCRDDLVEELVQREPEGRCRELIARSRVMPAPLRPAPNSDASSAMPPPTPAASAS